MNSIKVLSMRVMPLPGSEISEIKADVSQMAKKLKCEVTFNHNGQEYIADDEGNVAKAKNNLGERLGYPD